MAKHIVWRLIFGWLIISTLTIGFLASGCAQELRYIADSDDYWQTPAETMERGGGDCEDLAIVAFFEHEQQGAWLVQGMCGVEGHMIAVWSDVQYDVADCENFEPLIYFNRTCYHLAGETGCDDATHIVKWNRILNRR